MRKILTSVLGVAGLLAVVMALASSPATAAKAVVTITTDDTPGTSTVSWETQGDCDPGSGTSGASGSASATVTATTPGGDTGDVQQIGVVTDTICNYEYKYSFVNAAGTSCAVELSGTTLETGVCTIKAKVIVTIVGAVDTAEELCTQGDLDDDVAGCDDDDDDLETVKRSDRNDGAVSKTEFTVTATVAGDDPNENCAGDSADSETGDDDVNTAALSLVRTTFDAGTCEYDITAALPAGFVADDDSNVEEDVAPAEDRADDNDADTDEDNIEDNQELTVSVASVNVYLVQNVTGDAGGASAAYSGFESSCGGPDELNLPGNLKAKRSGPSSTSGIYSTDGVTLVELRSGRYNITAALNDDKTDYTARTSYVLDAEGETCTASADIDDVPGNCTVTSTSPLALVEAGEAALIEYTIDCSVPVEPEAPADTSTDDMDDGAADDMDDGAADDMDDGAADDMDDGAADDMDDMDDVDVVLTQDQIDAFCRSVDPEPLPDGFIGPDPDCPTG